MRGKLCLLLLVPVLLGADLQLKGQCQLTTPPNQQPAHRELTLDDDCRYWKDHVESGPEIRDETKRNLPEYFAIWTQRCKNWTPPVSPRSSAD